MEMDEKLPFAQMYQIMHNLFFYDHFTLRYFIGAVGGGITAVAPFLLRKYFTVPLRRRNGIRTRPFLCIRSDDNRDTWMIGCERGVNGVLLHCVTIGMTKWSFQFF